MEKRIKSLKLSVSILKEGRRYIAYSPALDLSSSGKSAKDAMKSFGEATELFFDELMNSGHTGDVLRSLGWKKVRHEWNPPAVIMHTSETIRIPVAA